MVSGRDIGRSFPSTIQCRIGPPHNRTARIEPVTAPGAVYVTDSFAASLELSGSPDVSCDYVGHLPTAKNHGRLRMGHIHRRMAVPGIDAVV